jgi:hypothetical protein
MESMVLTRSSLVGLAVVLVVEGAVVHLILGRLGHPWLTWSALAIHIVAVGFVVQRAVRAPT